MGRAHGAAARLVLWLPLVLGLGAGCASPKPYQSGRKGFFQELSRLPSANGSGYAKGDRGPAARAQDDDDDSDDGTPGAMAVEERPNANPKRLEQFRKVGLRWPLRRVHVTSRFGKRGSDFHEGVDLQAKRGTTVFAAHPGTVLYAGSRIRGYGRMIIVRHTSGLSTVYAHNSKLLVRAGQKIRRGQKISISGNTGRTSGPHLHFEVRDGTNAVDPERLLPSKLKAESEVVRGPADAS